jgi:hypothetical protein
MSTPVTFIWESPQVLTPEKEATENGLFPAAPVDGFSIKSLRKINTDDSFHLSYPRPSIAF